MKEALVSRAYAHAIYELGNEKNVNVADELIKLNEVINSSNNLETLLFLDVFTIEEKADVLNKVLEKIGTDKTVSHFLNFLVSEKRLDIFPSIFKEVVVLDDHKRGFLRGTIEGALEVEPEFLQKVTTYLRDKLGKEPQLEYKKNEEVTAGYRVTVGDLQLDASIDNQLQKLKDSVLNS